MSFHRYAVLGANPNGMAMAADLALRDATVALVDVERGEEHLEAIRKRGGVLVEVACDSFPRERGEHLVPLSVVGGSVKDAVAEAEVVLLVEQPDLISPLVNAALDGLRSDQILVMCPGGVGGPLIVRAAAMAANRPVPAIAQIAAMLIGTAPAGAGAVQVKSRKQQLPVGVFPAQRSDEVLGQLKTFYPEFQRDRHIIETGLNRPAIGVHPIPMIMNATKIEQEGPYKYNGYDITPTMADVIDAVDVERMALLSALDVDPQSLKSVLESFYGVKGSSTYEVVHAVPAYQNADSPPSLRYRYLTEDVPTQTVPAASLARMLGLKTPLLDGIVAFTNAMHAEDYWRSGWNLDKLGIGGMSAGDIVRFLDSGEAISGKSQP